MKNRTLFIGLALLALAFVGCSTVTQTAFYRPANYQGEAIRISGKFVPDAWTGTVFISVNDKEIMKKRVPAFTSSTEVKGDWDGKAITVVLTRINTFMSHYIRADVFFGSEKATTLTF